LRRRSLPAEATGRNGDRVDPPLPEAGADPHQLQHLQEIAAAPEPANAGEPPEWSERSFFRDESLEAGGQTIAGA
jgi:hypothetical protein